MKSICSQKTFKKRTPYLSVFSPNAGKYGLERLLTRTLFTQHQILSLILDFVLTYIDGYYIPEPRKLSERCTNFLMISSVKVQQMGLVMLKK